MDEPNIDRRPPRRPRRTIIDAASLEAARRDPRVHRFWDEARAYGEQLRREGRDHSI